MESGIAEAEAAPEPGRTLRSPAELIEAGLLPADAAARLTAVAERYAIAVPPTLAALLTPGDPADPIGRQILPDAAELDATPDERADPIGDGRHAQRKGIVHRYPDRVLLVPTLACAVYCRFCFRRERVGPAGGAEALNTGELAAALDYIRERPEIREVVITGGDPLVLAPHRLAGIVQALDAISHLGTIRVHTRVPVAAPERITEAMLAALTSTKALFLALHANHPREFGPEARDALRKLARAGIALIGQSVLLRGVNDDGPTLEALMRQFVENRVKPYYLHHLDPAPGTGRFRTSIAEGQALMRHLRGRVSGLCQPHYVLDIPGGYGKSPIGPAYIDREANTLEDWQGQRHPIKAD